MRTKCLCCLFGLLSLNLTPGWSPLAAQEPQALENGDMNGDHIVDLSDSIYLLQFLFLGGRAPAPFSPCSSGSPQVSNGDSNGDGRLDISDAIHLLNWLFFGGDMPVPACKTVQDERVFPPGSMPFGTSYADWSAKAWKWVMAIPAASNPLLGRSCGLNQAGDVWFTIFDASGEGITRECTVPAGKAILFPLISYLNDYPCPDPSFRPAPGQTLQDFLTRGARDVVDTASSVECEVDAIPIEGLASYRVTTGLFTFTGDPSLAAAIDPCITGSAQQAVADGYWIMLRPPTVGVHFIHVRNEFRNGGTPYDITYKLTIAP